MKKAVVRFLIPAAVVTSATFSATGIAAASPANPHACPVQAQGMAGPCVTLLQSALHMARVDGIFGPETRAAVIAYQRSHGLQVDGQAGPQVYYSLFPVHGAQ